MFLLPGCRSVGGTPADGCVVPQRTAPEAWLALLAQQLSDGTTLATLSRASNGARAFALKFASRAQLTLHGSHTQDAASRQVIAARQGLLTRGE